MNRRLFHPIGLALLAMLSWSATARGADYSFSLNGPNTAENEDGDVFRTTGSGTFDTTAETVVASGSFTHFDPDGTVVARGTWSATAFDAFSKPGGIRPGFQAGILEITVDLFPEGGGGPITESMKVVCNLPDNPTTPGGFQTGEPQGTTVGAFDVATSGFTLFNLI